MQSDSDQVAITADARSHVDGWVNLATFESRKPNSTWGRHEQIAVHRPHVEGQRRGELLLEEFL